MPGGQGPLKFDASLTTSDFKKGLSDLENRIKGFTGSTRKEADEIDAIFKKLGGAIGGYFAVTELKGLVTNIVKVRGEFQQLEIAFTTMLKSKAKADALMGQIVDFAAKTPFNLTEVATGAKQLLAYGSSAEKVVDEIKTLGDVAAGVSAPLGDLIYLYGTLRTQGRAYTTDIRQFAGRGIPIYEELAKVLKINTAEVNNFVESGRVGFKEVEQAFRNMTSAGGIFEGLTEKQSKSLTGLISNLGDAVDRMYNQIGQSQEGFLAGVIKGTTSLVDNYQEVIKILTVLVATYGAYKAAVATVVAFKAAESTSFGAISAAINGQSGGYAREIALKVKSTQATANRTAAIAAETQAQAANAIAITNSLRAEVSALSVKKASAVQSAKTALAEVAAAKLKLTAAEQDLAASATSANIKRVQIAQNALLIATEKGVAARKLASARISEFNATKIALETSARKASSLTINANSAASIANIAATNASAVASTRLTAVQSLQIAITRQLAIAQAAFNASLLSNPIVLFTVSIAALAGAMWYLNDSTSATEKAQKQFNETIEEAKKKREELLAKTQSLVSEINNETASRFGQARSYKELQGLFPTLLKNLTLQEFKTISAEEAQRKLNQAVDSFESANLSNDLAKANKSIDSLKDRLKGLLEQQGQFGGAGLTLAVGNTREELEKAKEFAAKLTKEFEEQKKLAYEANTPVSEKISNLQVQLQKLEKQRSAVEAIYEQEKKITNEGQTVKSIFAAWSLNDFNKQIKDTAYNIEQLKKGAAIVPSTGGDFKFWTELKKVNEEGLRGLGINKKGSKEWNEYASAIKKADKALEAYNLTSKKDDKPSPFGSLNYLEKVVNKIKEAIGLISDPDSQKARDLTAAKLEAEKKLAALKEKLDKDYADGSVEYYKKIASNAENELSKINPANKARIAELRTLQTDAIKKANDLEKTYTVKSFEETLEEKKKQYELYNLWLLHTGKEAADKQFEDLIKQGGSIEEFLKNRILGLRNKISVGVAVDNTDYAELVRYETELENINNGFEKYKQRISDAADELTSLTEKIKFFQAEQAKVSPFDTARILFLTTQRLEAEKQRKSLFKDFQIETNLQESTRLKIQKKYIDLRSQAENEYADKKSEDYKRAIEKINQLEKEELDSFDQRLRKLSENTQLELNVIISGDSLKNIANFIKETQEKLQKLKVSSRPDSGFSTSEVQYYITLTNSITQAQISLNDLKVEKYQTLANLLGQVGGELASIEGFLGDIGKSLTLASSKGSEFLSVMKSANQSKFLNKAAKEAQDFANTQVGESKEIAIKAAQEVAAEASKAAKGASASLIGLGITLVTEVIKTFTEQKRLNDELDRSRNNFQREYNSLLIEEIRLNSIRNEGFVKNYKGITNDAIAAASLAQSKLNELGLTFDRTLGVIVKRQRGLFGIGNFDITTPLKEAYPDLYKTIDGVTTLNIEVAELLINSGTLTQETIDLVKEGINLQKTINDSAEQINDVIDDLVGSIGDDLRNALVDAFRNGTDAAKAFGDTVSKVLENIIAQTIFSTIFSKAFDDLKTNMQKSLGNGGDGIITDDLAEFFKTYPELVKVFTQGLSDAQKEAQKQGLDIFQPTGSSGGNSLSGSIKSMTEETAGVLAGQFNAIRITGALHLEVSKLNLDVNRSQLLALTRIANNSDYLHNLESMNKHMAKISSAIDSRSGGLT